MKNYKLFYVFFNCVANVAFFLIFTNCFALFFLIIFIIESAAANILVAADLRGRLGGEFGRLLGRHCHLSEIVFYKLPDVLGVVFGETDFSAEEFLHHSGLDIP